MFLSYLPLKLVKTLLGGTKKFGMEALFLLFRILLSVFILVGFWVFIASFGKMDLIGRFLGKRKNRTRRE